MIDLRSDTVTRPTPQMLEAMFSAPVGDDVFGEDPSINALEQKAAALFGMQAALFCPSGTMCNQIAIKTHTMPLDEVICHSHAHIYHSETGAWAFHSGVSLRLVGEADGIIRPADVQQNINPVYDWQPRTSLLAIENTCNKAGGSFYTLAQMEDLAQACRQHQLAIHLDGARIFNAMVKTNSTPAQIGALIDSLSVCLSKGLGAPVGSLLLGTADFIKRARRIRKAFGGGMRQAGYLAAAGSYALDHHVARIADDHQRAQLLGETLQKLPFVARLYPVQTNIVLFDLNNGITAAQFNQFMLEQGIRTIAFGANQVRMVTHLDFTDAMLEKTIAALHLFPLK